MKLNEFVLNENVGGYDLLIRALLGTIAIIILALGLAKGVNKWITVFIAFFGIFTSITRHCGLYSLIGINTANKG